VSAVVVAGSSTLAPVMTDIARRFEQANAGIAVEIQSVGTGVGIAALRAGRCEIAMISRPVAEAERDLFAFPLARDGAAIVVHRTNPVRGFTSAQLIDVLTGKITDWKQLGGRSGAIRIAWRTEGQGIPDLLLHQLKLKNEQIRSHALFFENTDAVKYAAQHREGIAFAALGVAERSVKSGVPVKLLGYEGVAASNQTLRDHSYALSRPLILLTRDVPTGVTKRLVDFAVSSAVVDLHEKHGFVPYRQSGSP
jgi:phosphate transport system substrate-binding protein